MALVQLRIRDLAVVSAGVVEPGPGFSVLSGETGSGKSVCITALRLALGGRVDGDPIRPGAAVAAVAAVFDMIPDTLRARLLALGVPGDELLTLSRDVVRGGRGGSRINGAVVSLGTLREVGEALVELTAQGESHRLLQPGVQRGLLDASGGPHLRAAAAACAAAVQEWRGARARLDAALEGSARQAEQLAGAMVTVADLEPLHLRSDSSASLTAERERLRHAAQLRATVDAVTRACAGDEEEPGVAATLAAVAQTGRAGRGLDVAVDLLLDRVETLAEMARDLAHDGRRCADDLVADDTQLVAVEERLDMLERVRRRYGTLEQAMRALEAARGLVAAVGDEDLTVRQLRAHAGAAAEEATVTARRLTELRQGAARRLERAVHGWLRRLQMPQARFRVLLDMRPDDRGLEVDGRRVACGPHGVDAIEFRLATSRQGLPVPLGQGQSGGELSRLALALRAVAGDADDVSTLVLDEVDAGVGGETAARIGELLAEVGRGRQVLAVTHRAEIAARAVHHTMVTKEMRSAGPASTFATVEDGERLTEIARLLSGRSTAAALARARELLQEGASMRAEAAARGTI